MATTVEVVPARRRRDSRSTACEPARSGAPPSSPWLAQDERRRRDPPHAADVELRGAAALDEPRDEVGQAAVLPDRRAPGRARRRCGSSASPQRARRGCRPGPAGPRRRRARARAPASGRGRGSRRAPRSAGRTSTPSRRSRPGTRRSRRGRCPKGRAEPSPTQRSLHQIDQNMIGLSEPAGMLRASGS